MPVTKNRRRTRSVVHIKGKTAGLGRHAVQPSSGMHPQKRFRMLLGGARGITEEKRNRNRLFRAGTSIGLTRDSAKAIALFKPSQRDIDAGVFGVKVRPKLNEIADARTKLAGRKIFRRKVSKSFKRIFRGKK